MNRSHPETALIPYLRGELTDEERASVARHLEGCAACREMADSSMAAMRELTRRVKEVPIPDPAIYRAELDHKLRAGFGTRTGAEHRWLWPRIPGLSFEVLGAAAAASILVLLMHHGARVAPPLIDQPAMEDVALQEAVATGADVGLLRDYAMVEQLDLLENYDVIAHLDEPSPSAGPNEESRS